MRPLSEHRQDAVIAVIDELIDETLARGEQSHHVERCPRCRFNEWHGLPYGGCPGSTDAPTPATEDKFSAAAKQALSIQEILGVVTAERLREAGFVDTGYTIERIEEMRAGFERNDD